MKQFKFVFMLTMLMSMVGLKALAYDLQINGIYYNVDIENFVATVTAGEDEYSGNLIIPEEITYRGRNFHVTEVSFGNMPNLESLTLPNSITRLTLSACDRITTLDLPQSLLYLDCHLVNIESLYLPDQLKAFNLKDCASLRILENVPDAIEEIQREQFMGCKSLQYFKIGPNVKTIGKYAFCDCSSLLGIDIPSNVTLIDDKAFARCKKMEFFTIEYDSTPLTVGCGNFVDYNLYKLGTSTPKGILCDMKLKKLYIDREIIERGRYEYDGGQTWSVVVEKNLWELGCDPEIIDIGEHITEIPFYPHSAKEIRVHSNNPFSLVAFKNNSYSFPKDILLNGTLYVPIGSKEKYLSSEMWKGFLEIKEVDYETFYTKNLHIICNSNGSARLNDQAIPNDYNTQFQENAIVKVKAVCDNDHYLEMVPSNNGYSDSFYWNESTFVIWNDMELNMNFVGKKEYIEIDGVKWTKGNFQYLQDDEGYWVFKPHYRLAPNQWSYFEKSTNTNKDYFTVATDYEHIEHVEELTNGYCRRPTLEDAESLVNSSCQYGYYEVGGQKIYGTLVVDSHYGYSTSIELVKRFDDRDMEIGLFLPCTYKLYDTNKTPHGTYLTSTEYKPTFVYARYSIESGRQSNCDLSCEYASQGSLRLIWIKTDENTNSINAIPKDNIETPIAYYYDLSGRRINQMNSGIYIVKYSNGKSKKVFVSQGNTYLVK